MSAIEIRQQSLTHEQSACFHAMRSDLRAVAGINERFVENTLFTAFSCGTSAHWCEAVQAVQHVLNIASANTAARPKARLAQFVAENADLLQSNDR
jgi:hypothetical protein